jgi:LEA14-like dessication related protein
MRLFILALLAALAAGCSTIGYGTKVLPPEVHIADLELMESGLFEQRYRVTLRVSNPNDFELPLDGVRFALALNDQPFARGFSNHGVSVPRLGDAIVTVEATTSTFDIIRQVLAAQGRETLDYALDGTVFIKGGSRREVPFVQEGRLELLPTDAVRKLVPAPGDLDQHM